MAPGRYPPPVSDAVRSTRDSIPAIMAPSPPPRSPWSTLTHSVPGVIGLVVLAIMVGACVLTIPWTFGSSAPSQPGMVASPRYDDQIRTARHLPPFWWGVPKSSEASPDGAGARLRETSRVLALEKIAEKRSAPGSLVTVEMLEAQGVQPTEQELREATPRFWLGTDLLGRSVLMRCLAGGGLSLGIGIAAAFISVLVGTLYGALAGYVGGRVDATMMRIVDTLYGLPYILLVVLLAVAMDSVVENWQVSRAEQARAAREAFVQSELDKLPLERRNEKSTKEAMESRAMVQFGSGEVPAWKKQAISVVTLLVAIGGVSWLTMARVVRGQVLSLKAQPFMEAARAMGVGVRGQFVRHLLPNLVGPIVVYATLTVPQAILQESFLSFLGIGVKPPLPSWGNLAADGLSELNPYKSHWWLLVFPCVLLGGTLLALNFVGEGLREALDPKRSRR